MSEFFSNKVFDYACSSFVCMYSKLNFIHSKLDFMHSVFECIYNSNFIACKAHLIAFSHFSLHDCTAHSIAC